VLLFIGWTLIVRTLYYAHPLLPFQLLWKFVTSSYYGKGGMWSVGYFVSTVGLDEDMIRKYVIYQEKEDSGQTKFVLT